MALMFLFAVSGGCVVEFRLALIQLAVSASKVNNLNRAAELIAKAAKQGAQLLALPVDMPA
jgi:hypothetical protein